MFELADLAPISSQQMTHCRTEKQELSSKMFAQAPVLQMPDAVSLGRHCRPGK
jgi:hypothetical protein